MKAKDSHYPIIKVAEAAGVIPLASADTTFFQLQENAWRAEIEAIYERMPQVERDPLVHRTLLRTVPSISPEEARKPEDGWNVDEVTVLQGEMSEIASQGMEDSAWRVGRPILEDAGNQGVNRSQEQLMSRQRSNLESWEERGLSVDERISSSSIDVQV